MPSASLRRSLPRALGLLRWQLPHFNLVAVAVVVVHHPHRAGRRPVHQRADELAGAVNLAGPCVTVALAHGAHVNGVGQRRNADVQVFQLHARPLGPQA